MARTFSRPIWSHATLAAAASAVAVTLYWFAEDRPVDTEAMLDVSVTIRTISHVHIDRVGDTVWESGSGSGFLVSADRCEVWTNHHVVEDAALIEVFPRGWSATSGIPAEVVGSTPRADLALLRMDHCDGIPEARLGRSVDVRPGDETYAVGNPLGRNPDSISRGIISHTERYLGGIIPYLQTDAAINPGNSGGALFNHAGEVVGINTAIASTGPNGNNVGIGYAVPVDIAAEVVAELREGPPSWGDAGIADVLSPLSPDEAALFRVSDGRGAVILVETPTEGPSAGKLEVHDVVVALDGNRVEDVSTVMRLLSARDPGDEVQFEVLRHGAPESVPVTLVEGWASTETPSPDEYEGLLGMTLEMWTDRSGEEGRFKSPVITFVQSLGPAHRARISSSQRGFGLHGPILVPYQLDVKMVTGVVVDGAYHSVTDVADLEQYATRAFRADEPLLLEIEHWARTNPLDATSSMQHNATAFFKVTPALPPVAPGAGVAEPVISVDGTPIARHPPSSRPVSHTPHSTPQT